MDTGRAIREHLKETIIRVCEVPDVTAEQVGDDDILFHGTGALSLTSLDSIEIAVALEREFGLKMQNVSSARDHFQSVRTLADFVERNGDPEKIRAVAARRGAE